MQIELSEVAPAWAALADTVFLPHTQEEYDQIVLLMDQLIDVVGEDENHPLASLMEILGVLIEHYETTKVVELVRD
jgi:HTH-type transcriptional regulator/antitoxin HigA